MHMPGTAVSHLVICNVLFATAQQCQGTVSIVAKLGREGLRDEPAIVVHRLHATASGDFY